jgi:hypothetical protein
MPNEPLPPTPDEKELLRLPLLGIVALTARCLERAMSMIPPSLILPGTAECVCDVITLLWRTAENKDPVPDLEQAEVTICGMCPREFGSSAGGRLLGAAVKALRAARNANERAPYFGAKAAEYAANATSALDRDIRPGIRDDFEKLCRMQVEQFPAIGYPVTRNALGAILPA